MIQMPDDLLLECYARAKNLKLCPDFIHLLEKEIQRRRLHPIIHTNHEQDEEKSCTI